MQIVMNIDESTYNYIMKYHNVGGWIANTVTNAILGGTPLPKGHGRLIDADALNRKDVNCANTPMNFIDTAQTIIEADKMESEDKR